MIGVVVWTDADLSKAVIWCEDHMDLAYYVSSDDLKYIDTRLSCGDVVEFELRPTNALRIARNVKVVEANIACGLVETLVENSADTQSVSASKKPERHNAEVVTLVTGAADLERRRDRERCGDLRRRSGTVDGAQRSEGKDGTLDGDAPDDACSDLSGEVVLFSMKRRA